MSVTVSIVLPAYNVARYFEETFRAVVAQTFEDWELLVMENASTDDTMDVVQRVVGEVNDPRIRVLSNPRTLPAAASWNHALTQTRGEFLKLVCADDIPTPDCLARQVRAMRTHPNVAMASGSKVIIDAQGRTLFERRTIEKAGVHPGREAIRNCILAGTNTIGDPVHVMWRRSAMQTAGMFDPDTVYATDVEFWFRLLQVGDLYWDPEVIGYYRIHGAAASFDQWQATSKSFLQMAREQVQRGIVSLTEWDLKKVACRAYAHAILRQLFYRFAS